MPFNQPRSPGEPAGIRAPRSCTSENRCALSVHCGTRAMWHPGITSVDAADWRMGEHGARFQAEGAREAEAAGLRGWGAGQQRGESRGRSRWAGVQAGGGGLLGEDGSPHYPQPALPA